MKYAVYIYTHNRHMFDGNNNRCEIQKNEPNKTRHVVVPLFCLKNVVLANDEHFLVLWHRLPLSGNKYKKQVL